MAHRSVRVGLAGVAFLAGMSVRYEGHTAALDTDLIGVLVHTASEKSAGGTHGLQPDDIDGRLPVKIEHLRLEPSPLADAVPSSSVVFDMVNTGSTSLTDIMFEISIAREPARHFEHRGILAGPYRLRTKFVLHPGYTMSFEMRVSNLAAHCECAPNVKVFSVRSTSRYQRSDGATAWTALSIRSTQNTVTTG